MRRVTRALQEQDQDGGKSGQLRSGVTLQERYLILGIIGSGGMSTVYRARDLHFPNVTKLIAIKEVISKITDPTIFQMVIRNFEREANILATLSHPAIPRIFDYFTQNDNAYLAMEYIEGKDIGAILEERADFLPEPQVVGWAIELCAVLSYLHDHKPQPVIFRDIKPSNLMIDQHGHVRVIDFGIARVFQPGEKGTMIGTEGYSPPEQYRGEASPAGDIYSLAATLHHLLTNRDPQLEPPFSFAERSIREINPEVSEELEKVIIRSLSYDPEDRFPSADAMRQALLTVARKTRMPALASTPQAPRAPGSIEEIWSFECEDEIRGTPIVHNGIVYVGCYDNNIYALNAKSGAFVWKYGTEGGIPTTPAAIEDMVFTVSEDHRLYALSAEKGDLLWVYHTDAPIRSSPTIYERHIFFGSDDGHLHAVNLTTGRRAWLFEAAGPIRSTPLVADERIYFGCETGDFCANDLRGEMKWRFRAKRAVTSSPIIIEGVVYFGSRDWTIYALSAEAGWEIWRHRMSKPTISTPAYAEGKIFIGCADHHIYAVDARSSREVWRMKTEHQVNASPFIHDDSLYCGSVDGSMYCLDFRSGRVRWQFNTGAPITGSAVVSDNVLYFGSNNGKLYALLT